MPVSERKDDRPRYKVAICDSFYNVDTAGEIVIEDMTYTEIIDLMSLVQHGKVLRIVKA